jgi:hypothetical protein
MKNLPCKKIKASSFNHQRSIKHATSLSLVDITNRWKSEKESR